MTGPRSRGARARRGALPLGLAVATLAPGAAASQDLADFDYENLAFRGIGAEWASLHPTRVETTESWTLRLDLGYLGPGVRIVPSVGTWTSPFDAGEVEELENRVAGLVSSQTGGPPPTVDLGVIVWRDVVVSVDAHVVWEIPFDFMTFAGLGFSAHLLDGSGPAIDGTFVEDLLDSATAGFNLHLGLEYPLLDRFRVYGQGRYEVLGDLQYVHAGTGVQILFGELLPGEERRR